MCGLSIKQEHSHPHPHPHPQKQRGQTEAIEIGRKFRREGGVLQIPKFSPAADVFVMSEAYNKHKDHVEKYAREKVATAANASDIQSTPPLFSFFLSFLLLIDRR